MLIVGEVLTLDLLTFQTTPLSPFLTPRDYVGVAQVGKAVFAFGGRYDTNPKKICEKSSMPCTHWSSLPPMHYARTLFTPCVFQALIYLASANRDHEAVESFSPTTETFTVLPVSLTPDLVLGFGSVAFIINGELVLLTGCQQIARWKVEEAHFRVSDIEKKC